MNYRTRDKEAGCTGMYQQQGQIGTSTHTCKIRFARIFADVRALAQYASETHGLKHQGEGSGAHD